MKNWKQIVTISIWMFLGVALFIGLIITSLAYSAEPKDIQQIISYIQQEDKNAQSMGTWRGMPIFTKQLLKKVKLVPAPTIETDYWAEWEEHLTQIVWLETKEGNTIPFLIHFSNKHVVNSINGPYQTVDVANMNDYDADGIVEGWVRILCLVIGDRSIWSPDFPHGFTNDDWYYPAQEIRQQMYDTEVQFWLNQIEKKL